jgi:hypothetical protein
MHRRHLPTAAAAAVFARLRHGAPLPPAAPSLDAVQRLRGGVAHRLAAGQEAQRVTGSSAPAGPTGRMPVIHGNGAGRGDRGRFTQARVLGQMESCDLKTDGWRRQAVAAVRIGGWIHVAGGAVQPPVHDASTLA